MEPIEGVGNIPASRWKLTCYICRLKVGACIQCSNKSCYTSFHVSCARRAKLFLQNNVALTGGAPRSFCDKHAPDWYKAEFGVDQAFAEAQRYFAVHADYKTQSIVGGDVSSRGKFVISLKRSKQSAVVPAIVFAEILSYMQKFRIRNKAEFIADLCKYWSLKRRARRGASLLKRLQVQIDDSAAHKMDDSHKKQHLEFSKALLHDLDDYHRPLLEDLMEREMAKMEKCAMRDTVIEQIYLPLQPAIKKAASSILEADTYKVLTSTQHPTATLDGTENCLTWPQVQGKIDQAQYLSVAMFEADITTVLQTICEAFPEGLSREHKMAVRLQDKMPAILSEAHLDEKARRLESTSMTATCFSEDFEPDGLIITEERPFNWAIRDASPLSDLDDEVLDQMTRDVELERSTTEKSTPLIQSKKVDHGSRTPNGRGPSKTAFLVSQRSGSARTKLKKREDKRQSIKDVPETPTTPMGRRVSMPGTTSTRSTRATQQSSIDKQVAVETPVPVQQEETSRRASRSISRHQHALDDAKRKLAEMEENAGNETDGQATPPSSATRRAMKRKRRG